MKFNKFVWARNTFAIKRNVPATSWILACNFPPLQRTYVNANAVQAAVKINTGFITVGLLKLGNAAVFPFRCTI